MFGCQAIFAFVYKDGFARLSTVPFTLDPENLSNKYVHLTNSSIQRHNQESMQAGEDQSAAAHTRERDYVLGGTKLNFTTLEQRLTARGIKWDNIWTKICDVVLKSLCCASDHIPYQPNSFELFGYDVMIDTNERVWLIEVNASPSMGQEHLLDEQVKIPLIEDTIDLVEPMAFDRRALVHVLKRRGEHAQNMPEGTQRQQLNIDVAAMLQDKEVRPYGAMPEVMGNYERVAPGPKWDGVLKVRQQLFKTKTDGCK